MVVVASPSPPRRWSANCRRSLISRSSRQLWAGEATRQQRVKAASYFRSPSCRSDGWLISEKSLQSSRDLSHPPFSIMESRRQEKRYLDFV